MIEKLKTLVEETFRGQTFDGRKERELSREFAKACQKAGYYAHVMSDIPGAHNPVGYDLLVMSDDGHGLDLAFVEVKKQSRLKTRSPEKLLKLLRPSQETRRLTVKLFGSRRSRFAVLVFVDNPPETILEDVTDL